MWRIGRYMVATLVIGAVWLAYVADAQQPAPPAPQAPKAKKAPSPPQTPQGGLRGQAAPQAEPAFQSIPTYQLLVMGPVQEELKLDNKQREQIQQLRQTYSDELQKELQSLGELSPQEQQRQMGDVQRRGMKRLDTLRQKLEGTLTDQQLQELRQIAFRVAVPTALANPQILERLQVSDKQKEQIQKVNEKTQEKIWNIEQEMAKESLDVLTPEQQNMLQQLGSQD